MKTSPPYFWRRNLLRTIGAGAALLPYSSRTMPMRNASRGVSSDSTSSLGQTGCSAA